MASIIKVGKKWRAQVRRKGLPVRTQTFSTKALAAEWARREEGAVEASRAGAATGTCPSLAKLIERYIEDVGKSKPLGADKSYVLSRIASPDGLGLERADRLTPERIVKYLREDCMVQGPTAMHHLVYLKGVLKIARALWRYPVQPDVVDDAREIMRHVGLLRPVQRRDRRPTSEELATLRAWLSEHRTSLTVDVLDFILHSCFRPPSELRRLRWDDLNEVDRTIVISDRKDPRRKIGNDQTVPLLNGALDIAMRQPRDGEFIFKCGAPAAWTKDFIRACKACKIDDLRLYDLRHEAISRLVETGKYSVPEICLVSGHKDPKQLLTYTQIRAKTLHDR